MIELSAKMLVEHLPANRELMDIVAKRFNDKFLYHWGRIVEFLKLHYVLSKRSDTEYWRDNCDPKTIPADLQDSLELWRYESPWRDDLPKFDELFSAASYQYVLYGMGFETKAPDVERRSFRANQAAAEKSFYDTNQRRAQLLNALPTNRELIGKVHEFGFQKI